ncbi:MAG: hypothetical protein K6T17_02455, partial [Fimbriimonadales bacterium]|nr:hypothetical protein [Fimbriimonadales bacterium]
KVGEQVYFQEAPPAALLGADAVLIRKERIAQPPAVAEPPPQALQPPPATPPGPGVKAPAPAAPSPEAGVQCVRLRVKMPWDKFSGFVRGVIEPLRNDGAELDVEVLVQARLESGGIKPATLEHKVKETLRQIGAEILEERYE